MSDESWWVIQLFVQYHILVLETVTVICLMFVSDMLDPVLGGSSIGDNYNTTQWDMGKCRI